ncbi:MAG TPA: RsmE family RNA methyltransferase [Planctomicrobium sp.]|nr:RsmE family RNA methyltransferase [Planctomicrobium sp.]
MPDRFYLPGTWSSSVELEGTEAHHLANVLRAKPGDQVELFNGEGGSAVAEVRTVKKRTVQLQLVSEPRQSSPPKTELVLAVASPKGDRLRWMIEKMTELGVDRFIPLKTARSVVDPGETKLAKLEQTIISASKQCHRDWLLKVESSLLLSELPNRFDSQSAWVIWGDADGRSWSRTSAPEPLPKTLVAVIGPEGGFTEEEKGNLLGFHFQPISFSQNILRIETAAIAGAALLQTCRLPL